MTNAGGGLPTSSDEAKELRLALVCYGGVSLAVSMHGVTKEIHRLVKASKLLESGPDGNEAPGSPSEGVYREVLRQMLEEHPEKVRTRVVVDVIAGTSAGGINGVYLAKALAHNRSQEQLRDLWLERGDIQQLLRGPRFLPIWLKVPWLLWRAKRQAPLRGDAMSVWLFDALEDMDRGGSDPPKVESLMPDRHLLQLFVTMTDFYGYNRQVVIDDPRLVHDRRHRHVLEFRYDGAGDDHFAREQNGALAFAARATSCFPGAFPPVGLDAFAGYLRERDVDLSGMETTFFRPYGLSNADARDTYFIDGGVLDNRPFGHVIKAIRERPASVEVDRRLLYLEPDPGKPGQLPAGEEPNPIATVLGAVVGIPRKEPILDDLVEVAKLNERVRRVRDIIEISFDPIADRVESIMGGPLAQIPSSPASETLTEWSDAINAEAEQDAGFAYATYIRMKISGVVDRYAAAACAVSDYPAECNQAFLARSALRCWAEKTLLFEKRTPPSPDQIRFLQNFDLEYGERRLRFVIAGLNWWFRHAGEPGYPTRAELDAAKTRLYEAIDTLSGAMSSRGFDADLSAQIRACFAEKRIEEFLRKEGFRAEQYVAAHEGELDRLAAGVRAALETKLSGFSAALYRDLYERTEGWDAERRKDLLVRYLGFPFWDVLLYPIQALSDVGERDHVEVTRMSPADAQLLRPPAGGKLKGVAFFHFGAFFERGDRENDYLWGRLDSAERLIGILLGKDHPSRADWCRKAFGAILDEEEASLPLAAELIRDLRTQIASR